MSPEATICPACGRPAARQRFSLHDDRFGAPGRHPVCGCPRCGHHFLSAPPLENDLGTLYAGHYPLREAGPEALAPYRRRGRLAEWLTGVRGSAWAHVPMAVAVLDVGCGSGASLHYHRRRGCDAWGIEIDPRAAAAAAARDGRLRIGSPRSADLGGRRFDYVTLDQVLEHLADPVGALADLGRRLRPGGRIVVGTPNAAGWGRRLFGRRWVHWHVPYHCQFFTPRSLAAAARRAGLACGSLRWATRPQWWLYQWNHLAARGTEGRASPFWSLRPDKPLRLRLLLLAIRLATQATGLNHVLARTGDACRAGENLLAVLHRPPPNASS